jgi:hypothetical protein
VQFGLVGGKAGMGDWTEADYKGTAEQQYEFLVHVHELRKGDGSHRLATFSCRYTQTMPCLLHRPPKILMVPMQAVGVFLCRIWLTTYRAGVDVHIDW